MLKPEDEADIKSYLLKLDNAAVEFPFTRTLGVYSVNGVPFAYLETGRSLLELSLRIDHELAKLLRSKYEEVSYARKLDKRIWSTLTLSGQLERDEILALIDHSYQMALVAD